MPLYIPNSIISSGNSTTIPLTSGSTFTGTGEQNGFSQVGVMVKTDQAGTLYFDFSNDGTNWDSTFPVNGFKVAANISEFHTAVKLGRYFRCRFVNGTDGDQTYIRLSTYYGESFVPSAAPVNQTAGLDQDAIFTRGTIAQDEIRIGRRSGVSGYTKFGYNDDVDTGSAEVIAAQGGTYTPMATAETFTVTYNSTTDGADGGATGALTLSVEYVDSSGNSTIGVHTLGSDGSDTTAFSAFGINRIAVASSGTADVNVNDITFTSTTYGVQGFVPAGKGVTQQLIFTNGANDDAVAKFLWINVRKLSGGGGSPRVTINGWVYNRNVDTKYAIFDYRVDTSVENTMQIVEPIGFNLSPTDVFWLESSTDTNNTAVVGRFSLNRYTRT